jgi:hypothetical protein
MLTVEEIYKLTDEEYFEAFHAEKMTHDQFLFYFYIRP